MDKFIIKGGYRLTGEVEISGAKNAALPLMSACLLTDKECILEGVPYLKDIDTMGKLLASFGSELERDKRVI